MSARALFRVLGAVALLAALAGLAVRRIRRNAPEPPLHLEDSEAA